jgi:(R,R)-butanediol dehydrogenase / meso-butanediol dehydrogenase / diacetyl reductase
MRAAVYHGAHDVRITEVPEPEPREDEALLRVLRSGICGTDATEWKSGPRTFPVDRVHPVTGHTGPMVMGHEFVGEVVRAAPGGRYAVGDVVASGAGVSCGECDRCREGRTNVCRAYYTLGLNAAGGLAELVAVPAATLVMVPEGMSLDSAGLAQPMAVGLHAARRSGVRDGDRVVLIGAGAIGTFLLTALRSLADVDLTVIDLPGSRLDRAERLGATRVVEAGVDPAEVRDLVDGPADLVIEASGASGQLDKAVSLLRPAGTVLQVGIPGTPQQVDLHPVVMQEISVLTTLAHVCGDDLGPALDILATTDVSDALLDSVRPLDDVPDQLERLATGGLEGKVLFDPTIEGSSHS